MNFYFRIMLFLIISPLILTAQEKNKCHKSTEGAEFWFGFMENRWYSGNNYLEITVTAREATTFSIYIGSGQTLFGNYSVGNNRSEQIRIPWQTVEATGSESLQDRGIHLIADKPVNVYALNYDLRSSDVAVIYPVESLGTEYFAMCYTPNVAENPDGSYRDGRNSEFLIVGAVDSTTVTIKPSVVTDKNKPADSTFTVILDAGQVYQVQSNNHKNLQGQGDLTGSWVTSNKPIAFYSGSLATTVPNSTDMCCWDHLYEQIPPVHSWGREFYAVPLKSREQDRYRILAAEDNTIVYIDGLATVYLNQGEFYEFILYYWEAKRILADKPILVAQFSQSQRVDYNFTNGNGDPFMIILSPSSQSKNDVTFVAYQSNQIKNYFVNIITLTSETGNIELDGTIRQNMFLSFPGTEYSYAQIPVNPGTHHLFNKNQDKGFLAYVYGFGGVESYGYGVGFNLDLILDIGQSINFEGDTLILCFGDSRTLDAGPYFDTYSWNTGDSTQRLTVTEEGKYSATTTTNDGCLLFDSIYIKMSRPETSLGSDRDSCTPYSVELDAGIYEDYLWSTGDTIQKIIADETGIYSVIIYDQYGCTASDTMELIVHAAPDVKIIGDVLICGDTTTTLKVELTNADPSLWNFEKSMAWSTNKPTKLKFSGKNNSQTKISVSEWGEYEVYFSVTTVDGCESSGQFTIKLVETPTSQFTFVEDSPEEKCKGYSREVLYIGNASESGNFYWNFEGSKIVDSLGWQNFRISLGANTIPAIHLVVEEDGCWSDTTSKLIGANPDFKLETRKSTGCDSTTIFFTGTIGVADSLMFEWDLGDGSPISNLQNTSHFYPDTGFYDVGLSVTNVLTGCRIAFTIDDFVKVFPTPVANFSADPDLCYPDSFNVIYLNNIDSSVCDWDFIGAFELGKGNDSIWVKIDSSMAEITLQVNEFGCLSNPVSKIVKRKPHFDFYTENEEGCQPYLMETTAIPYDDSLRFTWMHDTLPNVSASTDFYLFKDPDRFNIGLIANSLETQCTDTLVKQDWIWVHPKPVANFEVDYPVATIENSTVSFTNLSNPNLTYFWDFGDGSFSESTNPQHTYSELGDFFSQLIAQSEFGCLDTTGFLIKIVPFSVFTPNAFRPDSEIPENRYFMPVGLGVDPGRFNIKIYNRWGILVFESNNPDNKWDGKLKNGQSAPMENYVWVAVFLDIQGFEHKQNGQVLLIR